MYNCTYNIIVYTIYLYELQIYGAISVARIDYRLEDMNTVLKSLRKKYIVSFLT